MVSNLLDRTSRSCLCMLAAGTMLLATGCQVDIAGQTLPSPWYQHDDIQYFPHGPEFMLSREAAAMDEYRARQAVDPDRQP